jgi:hypothetical protein
VLDERKAYRDRLRQLQEIDHWIFTIWAAHGTDDKQARCPFVLASLAETQLRAAAHENAVVNLPVEKLNQRLIINNLYY